MIEESLREMFAARVEALPVVDDPAGRAIALGRRRTRRRASASGLAVVTTLFLVVGGLSGFRGLWGSSTADDPPPQSGVLAGPGQVIQFGPELTAEQYAARPYEVSLDVLVGDRVATPGGRWYTLDGVGELGTIVRVPLGWVYGGSTRVRLMRSDGTAIDLLNRPGSWLVGPRGDRIAEVRADVLTVWPLTATGLGKPMETSVPPGTTPVAFVGDRVALRDASGDRIDVWDPRGGYRPRWKVPLSAVFDSSSAATFGIAPGAHPCLVQVNVGDGLAIGSALGCGDALDWAATRAVPSPDGRLLAVPTPHGLAIYELTPSKTETPLISAPAPVAAATCDADAATVPVWSAMDTVISTSDGAPIACSIGARRRAVQLPHGIGGMFRFIPIRA